ncbi:MAG TPA: J domain-containing protein [Bacteroidota bacterium]|nr:J domain-containing protein [Bacteroidota bacterium]
MGEHTMHKGVCIQCGCDANAIDYFGWSCSGRSIAHVYENETCTQCGFGRQVIEHFNWPCRLRKGESGSASTRKTAEEPKRRTTYADHFAHARRQEYSHPCQLHTMDDEKRFANLLGLKGKVTRGDIKYAYREQASLYHPDRVAHLGPELQNVANERMKEINQAFEFFRKKYGL